jgi:hypothetical protein
VGCVKYFLEVDTLILDGFDKSQRIVKKQKYVNRKTERYVLINTLLYAVIVNELLVHELYAVSVRG